jgi:drug/metabolite transporter (DMT)-like permease
MSMPPVRAIDARGAVLALVVSVLWGANPVAIKLGLEDAPPIRLAWMRFLVGGVVIVAWAMVTGRLRDFRIARDEWRPLLVLAALFTAQIASMNVGTALTSAAHAAVLLNLYAVHTVVLAHFLLPGDRLTSRKVAGVLVAYAGSVMLFARQLGIGTPTLTGDVVMVLSGLILAERTVYLARAVHHLDAVKMLLAQAVLGTAVFLVVSALVEAMPTRWTWRLAGSIGYQGVVVAGFNFITHLWLLRRYRASALATFFLTQPVFGVIAAAVVTREPLTVDVFAASAAVAVGVGLTTTGSASGKRRGRSL